MKVVLASKSPRREELLKGIINDFTVCPSTVDEETIKIEDDDAIDFAITAAVAKAKDVGEKFPEALIIGADTIVTYKNKIIGKPESLEHAKTILSTLSGTRHAVVTGIALYNKKQKLLMQDYEITYVTMKELTSEMIDEYLSDSDFQDKAGSYAVQQVEDLFVEKIDGEYENVVGLPIKKLRTLIDDFKSLSS